VSAAGVEKQKIEYLGLKQLLCYSAVELWPKPAVLYSRTFFATVMPVSWFSVYKVTMGAKSALLRINYECEGRLV
jgi:hypothetical protein